MKFLRSLFTFIFIIICLSAFSQSADQPVFLKWRLKPGEVLTYKTVMDEIDTANHKDPDMTGMMKATGMSGFMKSTGSDTSQLTAMNKVMKQSARNSTITAWSQSWRREGEIS
ncbi:MAG: hypothetical protein JST32_04895 [Bacteroidetes bacterium]|nr:hypothetical protein [Bacteroidota bacterium]